MDCFQQGGEYESSPEKISQQRAHQDKESGYAQTCPAKQALEDPQRRAANFCARQQVVGRVLAGQFLGSPEAGDCRINGGGRDYSASRSLVGDVAANLFDDVAEVVFVHAAQPLPQSTQVSFNLLLRIA